jgi:hypothetical protein
MNFFEVVLVLKKDEVYLIFVVELEELDEDLQGWELKI